MRSLSSGNSNAKGWRDTGLDISGLGISGRSPAGLMTAKHDRLLRCLFRGPSIPLPSGAEGLASGIQGNASGMFFPLFSIFNHDEDQ
ncbi:hypothetical protein AD939_11235 [Gluconobacter oxydans]|nr:hypothetical protein AD939_11235 [Gluconobacter oxydans]